MFVKFRFVGLITKSARNVSAHPQSPLPFPLGKWLAFWGWYENRDRSHAPAGPHIKITLLFDKLSTVFFIDITSYNKPRKHDTLLKHYLPNHFCCASCSSFSCIISSNSSSLRPEGKMPKLYPKNTPYLFINQTRLLSFPVRL